MSRAKKACLLLKSQYYTEGISIGEEGTTTGEICFNTGMTGYQELYTDPSYFRQILINTNAHIGNYGVDDKEVESDSIQVRGVVLNHITNYYEGSNTSFGLNDYFKKNALVSITNVDTRALVTHLREYGAMNAIVSSEVFDKESLNEMLAKEVDMKNLELASEVSTKKPYEVGANYEGHKKIAILDFGIKKSMLANFEKRNCWCRVFPAKTNYNELKSWMPDAYFFSNGPGDPVTMGYAIDLTKQILEERVPFFGICLGSQILAHAVGIETLKMHNGHRGLNHPVKNLESGFSEITSQNHGFMINMEQLKNSREAILTHINLNDSTVEGFKLKNYPAFAVQYHPEASPGPHDSFYLFDDFITLIHQTKI